MMEPRRRVAVMVAAGALGFAVTACGDDGGESNDEIAADAEGEEASTPSDAAADTTTGGSQPAGNQASFDTEARVRFGYPIGPSQGLDPHRSSQSQDHTFLGPLYDPLIIEMPDGELAPGLATEWEFDDAGEVLTLSLREGVTFHDGAEFDAAAVKANIERAKTVEGSAVAPLLEVVESVEVIEPMTVALHVSGPAATLPRVLADRPGMMISPDVLDDADLANNPVGAGMFRLSDFRPGDRAVYERFEDYWSPDDVNVSELEIIVQGDAMTRLNGLRNDELDIAYLEPPQFAEAESDDGLVPLQFDTTGLASFIQLNRTRSEFGDVRVRQAMNHAIDREAIVETLLHGYYTPSEQFYPESFPVGHVADLEDRYPYDPDRARALLEEAGLGDGFSFELIVPSIALIEQVAEVVQAQMAEVGITVELTPVEPTQAGNVFYTDQQGDAGMFTYPGRTDPAMTAQLFFTDGAHSNPGGHVPDGMDEAYAAALEQLPEDERRDRLQELMAITVEAAGNVIIAQDRVLVATQPNVTDFNWSMRGQPDFRGVAVTSE